MFQFVSSLRLLRTSTVLSAQGCQTDSSSTVVTIITSWFINICATLLWAQILENKIAIVRSKRFQRTYKLICLRFSNCTYRYSANIYITTQMWTATFSLLYCLTRIKLRTLKRVLLFLMLQSRQVSDKKAIQACFSSC